MYPGYTHIYVENYSSVPLLPSIESVSLAWFFLPFLGVGGRGVWVGG